jgi:tetratricopeptide (TPR) repeat protein
VTAPTTTGPTEPPLDQRTNRAALEEQRDFLLRSLDDLERERLAGDVDEHDYAALKDDYTARAAAVIRAIEVRRDPVAPRPSGRRWARSVAWAAGVVVFAVLAGVLVAQSAGRRDPGGFATGDIRQTVAGRLNEAGGLMSEGRFDEAIERYDSVLADQPANPEALTYRAWALRLSGQREEGFTGLIEAATIVPDYPDVHALLAVVFFQEGLYELAAREVELVEGLDAPADIRELIEPLAAQIDAAIAEQRPPGERPPDADPQVGGGT